MESLVVVVVVVVVIVATAIIHPQSFLFTLPFLYGGKGKWRGNKRNVMRRTRTAVGFPSNRWDLYAHKEQETRGKPPFVIHIYVCNSKWEDCCLKTWTGKIGSRLGVSQTLC
jgi:hypothetical protein